MTTTGNFTFEPTALLFVNYPEPSERPDEDSSEVDGFSSFVIAAGKNSSASGVTWPWGNSSDIKSENTTGSEGSENDENDENGISAECGLNHDDNDGEGGEDGDDSEDDEGDAIADLNISSALQVSINMTLNRSCKTVFLYELEIVQLTGTNSDCRKPNLCFERILRIINLFLHWNLRLW